MNTLFAQRPTPMTLTPPGLGRLSVVELRKATDTRAGRWLLVIIALIAVAAAATTSLVGEDSDHTLQNILSNTCGLTAFLLPVLGILLITSEWQQRTALTTFALIPRRQRVIAAKMVAGILLALAAGIICVAMAAAGTALATHGPAPYPSPWDTALQVVGYSLLYQILNVILGVGLGLLFLNTPVAIVVYFAIATGWTILTSAISDLQTVGEWFNPSTAWSHLADTTVDATSWARVATAAAVWVLVPAAAGTLRVTRSAIN